MHLEQFKSVELRLEIKPHGLSLIFYFYEWIHSLRNDAELSCTANNLLTDVIFY